MLMTRKEGCFLLERKLGCGASLVKIKYTYPTKGFSEKEKKVVSFPSTDNVRFE